jgi:glycosyltransferase involved in cell wall biosynthesis
MGFLVESFWDLGVEARGIDLSRYAISCVRPDMQPYCSVGSLVDSIPGQYDLVTCIEVLEHIPGGQAEVALANICRATDTVLFSSTPADFQEATHFSVRPLLSWLKLFAEQSFWPDLLYDASFVAPHAMLLRRSEAAWPEPVLTLFSRLLRSKMSMADANKELARLKGESSGWATRVGDLEAKLAEASSEREQQRIEREAIEGELRSAITAVRAERDELQTELANASAELSDSVATRQRVQELLQARNELESRLAQMSSETSEKFTLRQTVERLLEGRKDLEARLAQTTADTSATTFALHQTIRELSQGRRQLDARLATASEQVHRLRRVNAKAMSSIERLWKAHHDLTLELDTIISSPGWRGIERYRSWHARHITRRPWLGLYERVISGLLRWSGIAGTGTPTNIPRTAIQIGADEVTLELVDDDFRIACLGQANTVAQSSRPAADEVAQFALIISGCPGDSLRYRCEHQAEELCFLGLTVKTAWIDYVDFEKVLPQYQVFLLHRVPHGPAVESFILKARALGKPVLFDTDDLIFNENLIQYIRVVRELPPEEYELYVDNVRNHYRTLSLCSAVIVTTEHLRESVVELFPQMPVWINRNAVSDEMVRQATYALQNVEKPNDGLVRLAYLSGTKTHQDDFKECASALVRLLQKHSNVRFLAVGFLDLPEELRRMGSQIECIAPLPWQDLPTLMRRVDVSLAPLEENNRFTDSKSELKYFEAALLGVPTICSDVSSYRTAIVPLENGLICSTEEEWFAAMDSLVSDATLRERIGNNAREDAIRRYTTRSRAPQLRRTMREIMRQLAQDGNSRLSVAFVVSTPAPQAGRGHDAIFTLAHSLAERGHDVQVYLEPLEHLAGKTEPEILEFCEYYFGKGPAQIRVGHDVILPSDIAVATCQLTAYTVEALANTRCKAHLIQQYEPEFATHHFSEKQCLAIKGVESAYDLPLKKIALGEYLGELFSQRDRLPVPEIKLGLDSSIYHNRNMRRVTPIRILFWARADGKQRAYAAGVEGLRTVARLYPEIEIAFYGSDGSVDIGFRHEDLGELTPEQLALQMNLSHIHLSLSVTSTPSEVFKASACGCAVLGADTPTLQMWLNAEACLLVEPEPKSVAEELIRLIEDPILRQKVAQNGQQYIKTVATTPQEMASQFEEILLDSIFKTTSDETALFKVANG